MTREVMEDSGLACRWGRRLELVSHTGHSRPCLGLCEDVEVGVGGLKTRHPIFVVELIVILIGTTISGLSHS